MTGVTGCYPSVNKRYWELFSIRNIAPQENGVCYMEQMTPTFIYFFLGAAYWGIFSASLQKFNSLSNKLPNAEKCPHNRKRQGALNATLLSEGKVVTPTPRICSEGDGCWAEGKTQLCFRESAGQCPLYPALRAQRLPACCWSTFSSGQARNLCWFGYAKSSCFFRGTHSKLSFQFSWVVAMSAWAWSHPAASVKVSSTTWHNLTQLTQPGVTSQWTPWFTNYSNCFQMHILPLCSNPSQLSPFSAPYESGLEEREVGGGKRRRERKHPAWQK